MTNDEWNWRWRPISFVSLGLSLMVLLAKSEARAISIVPPKRVFSSNEVVWFSAAGADIITCWADGTVGVWKPRTGKLVNHFKLAPEHFDPENCFHSLCLTRQMSPMLTVIVADGRFEEDKLFRSLVTYGIKRGAPINTNSIETYACSPKGFVQNSSILVCAEGPPANPAVYWVDADKGKVVKRIETEDDVQTGTFVGLDGQVFVNFCRPNRLIARDRSGREVWAKTIANGLFAEPGYWPDSPSLPYVVVAESKLSDSEHIDFVALALRDGAELWRRRETKFGNLKAISRDGRSQAFLVEGGIELVSLPNRTAKRLSHTVPDSDAVFSDDQKTFLSLPALVVVSKTKDGGVVTMARASRRLQVFSTKSGKWVQEIDLRHPATNN